MYPCYLILSKVTDFFTLFLNFSDKISTGLVLVTVNTYRKHNPAVVIWNTGELLLTLRRLMSYTYGASNLDVSRSHTTTHHSR
jgi:hypothetical protein